MTFNENLQKLRKEKGLSQESLAEMLDVSRQAVSKWESGQSYPEVDKLIALSDIFSVTLDELVKGYDRRQEDSSEEYAREDSGAYVYRAERVSLFGRRAYEYKSEKTLFGLPLVHINIGFGLVKAKGIIAIGNIATGLISVGVVSCGVLSLGVLALGLAAFGSFALGLLIALGAIAMGTFAIGAIAVGYVSLGAVSIGTYCVGAYASAECIAMGDFSRGHIAVGRTVEGVRTFVDNSPALNLRSIPASEVRAAIYEEFPDIQKWIADFMCAFLGRG